MTDKKYPASPEQVDFLNGKAMELKQALHDKIKEFVIETGHSFVITLNNCEGQNDIFTCRPCY